MEVLGNDTRRDHWTASGSSVLAVGSHFSFGGLWWSLWSSLQEILILLEIDVPEREPDPVANHWPLDQGLLVAGMVTLVRVAAVLGARYPTGDPDRLTHLSKAHSKVGIQTHASKMANGFL